MESKPKSQSKSCWGKEEVRSQWLQGPGSGHDCGRSEGVAMPPFFSSCGCYWNFVKACMFRMKLKEMREVSLFSSSSSLWAAQSSTSKRYFQFSTVVRIQALHSDGPGLES